MRTSNNAGDAVVPHLLAQLPADESLLSVTGDAAYDAQPVYAAVMARNAMPIIPARKNAWMRKGAAFVHRNAAIWTQVMEELEWLSPAQPGGDQDALH